MVLYAAGAGQTALDRLGPNDLTKNGVFTRVLLREMQRPGIPVDRVLKNVRQEVVRLAQGVGREQVPALYDQSIGEFFFVSDRASASESTVQAPGAVRPDTMPVAPAMSADQREDKFWDDAKAAGNREAFEAYLSAYPRGRYASLAAANIARLNSGATSATMPPGVDQVPASQPVNSTAPQAPAGSASSSLPPEPVLQIFRTILDKVIKDK
jgi:hypothetical protein